MITSKIRFNWREAGEPAIWHEESLRFGRIPVVGEYVGWDEPERQWFHVTLVLHTPCDHNWEAMVCAVEVDPLQIERQMTAPAIAPPDPEPAEVTC